MKPQDFIDAIAPSAVESAENSKVPVSFTIAQAALESSWGESRLAKQGFNLFGVKADKAWHGEILTLNTKEFLKGQWVIIPANWRKYADWLECINDHARFLIVNPRYQKAFLTADGEAFAHVVANAGYATDPLYADKICSIIKSHDLAQYDK